jgi:hypothetical protein
MITYEQRVSKMLKPGDEDEQLRLAKQYSKKLRNEAKKQITLAGKLKINEKVKQAESVVRKLRQNIFDLEDMLFEKSI